MLSKYSLIAYSAPGNVLGTEGKGVNQTPDGAVMEQAMNTLRIRLTVYVHRMAESSQEASEVNIVKSVISVNT